MVAVLNALGGSGLLLFSDSPFVQQSRVTALQARWSEMVTQGVPASDLAALEQQLSGAQQARFLAAGSVFWWPDSGAIISAWEARTESVWSLSLSVSRTYAIAANERLGLALGPEPIVQLKERLMDLDGGSTPAQFNALSSDWNLAALLVPVNRYAARLVAKVADVAARASALGIVSTPAHDVLASADEYAVERPSAQAADAALLLRTLTALDLDLRTRLAAATITKNGFSRAARELSLVRSYGVNVSRYRTRIVADHKSYSTATAGAQFEALTRELNAIIARLHHAGQVALAAMHSNYGAGTIIAGVPLYYQTHSLSCEETATSMGLAHQGLHISQNQILARLGVDWTPARLVNGRVVRWGDPDKAFVGNVNGSENNYTGQQANPKALVRVLNSYGARIIEWSEPGVGPNVISAQEIYRQITAGHPVVAYATWDWNWHPIYYYTSEDGNRVPLISPADDHVYLVVGVSPTRVLVNDPIRGQYWVSKAAFQASYEFGMAIVLA